MPVFIDDVRTDKNDDGREITVTYHDEWGRSEQARLWWPRTSFSRRGRSYAVRYCPLGATRSRVLGWLHPDAIQGSDETYEDAVIKMVCVERGGAAAALVDMMLRYAELSRRGSARGPAYRELGRAIRARVVCNESTYASLGHRGYKDDIEARYGA